MSVRNDKEVKRQQDLVKSGKCARCRNALGKYRWYCDDCQGKHTKSVRKRLGLKKWKPGGRGRPPGPLEM